MPARAGLILLRVALVVTMTAAALVAAALLARFQFRRAQSSGRAGDFIARRAGGPSYRSNSLGFRDREVPPKSPDRYRIAVIGDSFAWGQGVEERDRFSNLLEEFLGPRYEVFNFGRPGNNMPEHLEMLRHVVAGPAEVEDFVPRTEEFLEQIREAVALLDALSPRERVADHGDAVAVGRFGRNLAIAEAEAVGSVRRTAGAAGDEIAGAAARLRATELKACEERGGDEGSRRHGDDEGDAEEDEAGSSGHARRRASVG